MKILLLSPPFQEDYMRNARCDFVSNSHTQWYPILLGYAGALLEKHGHQVKLIDAPAAHLNHRQVEEISREFKPDILVVYGGRLSEENDQEIADHLTGLLGCRTIFCGPFVSIAPQRWLEKTEKVLAAVAGEFDYPVLEFVEGNPSPTIKNLIYREGDEIVRNELRPYLDQTQLDAIPFVSEFFLRQVNLNDYRAISEPFPYMDMMTGRGCYWGVCSFCLWVHSYIQGPVYNTRSLENVLEEIDFIRTRIPRVKSLMFQDDSFSENRARELSEEFLRRNWKIRWSCYARAELSPETLVLMKRAGCLNLHVGFESATEEVLRKAAKGISREKMTSFVQAAQKAGLHIHGDFLMGLEGETKESLLRTVDWAVALNVDTAQFQVIIPFEGTPLYRSLQAKGWMKDGYPDYPELSTEMIQKISRQAYRRFYLRPQQMVLMLTHPKSRLWHYLKVAHKIIPSVFFPERQPGA